MRICSIAGMSSALLFGAAVLPAQAYNVHILDDDGYASPALSTLYTSHGNSVGFLTHDFGSTDLSGDQLVITMVPSGYSSGEISNLVSYVQGGGRLVLGSEFFGYRAAIGPTNAVLTALGSSIHNNSDDNDNLLHTTTDIKSSPFTDGVTSIQYAAYSSLSGGTALVDGQAGPALVAYEKIGLGYVFVIGDSNVAIQISDPTSDNGRLFLNFASAGSGMSTVPLPTSAPMFGAALAVLGAAGYRFKRRQATAA